MTNDKTKTPRRWFLKQSGKGAAALGVAPSLIKAAGANRRITLGIIGCGGRGTYLMKEAQNQGCRIAALCDIAEMRLGWARQHVKGTFDRCEDYRELLARKDIDAVVNATPDHWHHDVLIDAVKAGKDVYTEKPFSHSIESGNRMVAEVRKTRTIVQVGNHRRSGNHWVKARNLIASGVLGKITWARVFDTRSWVKDDPLKPIPVEGKLNWEKFLGKAPKREFSPHRYWAWRWFWDYAGGLMTDIGAHQLDILHWLTDSLGPKTIAANGGTYFFDHWETPDVVHAVLDFGHFSGVFSVGFVNKHDGVGAVFYGTEGTLVVTASKFYTTMEHGDQAGKVVESWERPYEGPAHVANWLSCIRSRLAPNSPVELGNSIINTAHAANMAYRQGVRVTWDAEKQAVV